MFLGEVKLGVEQRMLKTLTREKTNWFGIGHIFQEEESNGISAE